MTAVALLVAVAGATVVWWGHPRLGPGSTYAPGAGMTWANDGVEDTRMLVRGRPVATVSARFSIRNDGHLPFTVRGLDVTGFGGNWLTKQKVAFVPGYDATAAPAEQVTLSPGAEATVLWSLDLRCQPPLLAGSFMHIDFLPFEVSWWGIPATRQVPLPRPITFAGDDISRPLAGPECADDRPGR